MVYEQYMRTYIHTYVHAYSQYRWKNMRQAELRYVIIVICLLQYRKVRAREMLESRFRISR